MDNLLIVLANLGGGFTLAGVILLLHREALKAFREEMSAERAANLHIHTAILEKMDEHQQDLREALGRLEANRRGIK